MSSIREIFSVILEMSYSASFAVLGVIILRALFKKIPKSFSFMLWIIPFYRFLSPISPTSRLSLYNLFSSPKDFVSRVRDNLVTDNAFVAKEILRISTAEIERNVDFTPAVVWQGGGVDYYEILLTVASLIWLVGLLFLAMINIHSYLKIRRRFNTSTRIKGNVYESLQTDTAFICGFWKPRVILPRGIAEKEQWLLIEHEKHHLARGDQWRKLLAFFALLIHWFNPLAWIAFTLFSKDMEMSCDEEVLSRIGTENRKAYSSLLLTMSTDPNRRLAFSPLCFGEHNVKRRIKNILNYKKPKKLLLVTVLLLIFLSVLALGCNPLKNPEPAEQNTINRFAWEVIERDIGHYEENMDMILLESQLLRLESIQNFSFTPNTFVEVYALEYRLLFEDMDKLLLAGGMTLDDQGWLRETSSMGSPLLIIEKKGNELKSLGIIWTGTVAEEGGNLEESLRRFYFGEVAVFVEERLEIIMSSPKTSSSPLDYIEKNQQIYEEIIKFGGEKALSYILEEFSQGRAKGLRGEIMMYLARDILGSRDNVKEKDISAEDWYKKLILEAETILPDFQYSGDNLYEKLVCEVEVNQIAQTIVSTEIA